eukprot:scaffold36454_cov176-Amphora_coffeaeformis.AAC.2
MAIVASKTCGPEMPHACAATAIPPADAPANGDSGVNIRLYSKPSKTPAWYGRSNPPGDKENPIVFMLLVYGSAFTIQCGATTPAIKVSCSEVHSGHLVVRKHLFMYYFYVCNTIDAIPRFIYC